MPAEDHLDLDPKLDRRQLLVRGLGLGVAVISGTSLLAACGRDDGMMGDRMPEWMMSEGMMDPGMMEDMGVIHRLLVGHERISRKVRDIPGGIRSRTTTEDQELTDWTWHLAGAGALWAVALGGVVVASLPDPAPRPSP